MSEYSKEGPTSHAGKCNSMYTLFIGALELDEVRASDQGSYQCNATSLDQHRLTVAATLSIDLNLGEIVVTFEKFLNWCNGLTVFEDLSVILSIVCFLQNICLACHAILVFIVYSNANKKELFRPC